METQTEDSGSGPAQIKSIEAGTGGTISSRKILKAVRQYKQTQNQIKNMIKNICLDLNKLSTIQVESDSDSDEVKSIKAPVE